MCEHLSGAFRYQFPKPSSLVSESAVSWTGLLGFVGSGSCETACWIFPGVYFGRLVAMWQLLHTLDRCLQRLLQILLPQTVPPSQTSSRLLPPPGRNDSTGCYTPLQAYSKRCTFSSRSSSFWSFATASKAHKMVVQPKPLTLAVKWACRCFLLLRCCSKASMACCHRAAQV